MKDHEIAAAVGVSRQALCDLKYGRRQTFRGMAAVRLFDLHKKAVRKMLREADPFPK